MGSKFQKKKPHISAMGLLFWHGASNLVCSQKIMVLGQKQNLTPKMGVAYGHVTTFAISEIVTSTNTTLTTFSSCMFYALVK